MRFGLPILALCLYVVPAFTAVYVFESYGLRLKSFAEVAINVSALSAVGGYLLASALFRDNIYYERRYPLALYRQVSFFLIAVGILALLANFARIGSFPLVSGNEARIALQESFLWNVSIFCSVGIFLFASVYFRGGMKSPKLGFLLLIFYFVLVFLTGWKGTFLNFIFLGYVSNIKGKKLSLKVLFFALLLFALLFYGVNTLRAGDAEFDLLAPIFYVYWGFVNFSDFAGSWNEDCFYSVPLLACKLAGDQDLFSDPTWNVFTALTPLYADGGVVLVGVVFFVVSFFLVWSSRRFNVLWIDFVFYISFYFLFYAHNGYLFTSRSYVFMFALVVLLGALGTKRGVRKFSDGVAGMSVNGR